MIKELGAVGQDSRLEADLCVIGAGPAGMTLALECAARGRRVALLESGGVALDKTVQALADGETSGQPYFDLIDSRYRLLGGSTFRWGARSAPMKPLDLGARPWIPREGWPMTRAELDPHYQRAFELIGLRLPFAFDDDVWSQLKGKPPAFDPDKLQFTAFQFGKNVVLGEVLRDRLEAEPNLDLILRANVVAIRSEADGRRVTEVDVAGRGGERLAVCAKRYVLAAGGIENARMLLLSGLANSSGLVGRGFMEHPTISAGVVHASEPQRLQDMSSPGLVGGRLVEVGLALSPKVQAETGSLNAVARVVAKVAEDPTQALRELLWNARHRRLPHQREWYDHNKWMSERIKVVLSNPFSIVNNAVRHALGLPKRFKVESLRLEVRTEQDRNPDSRITLSEKKDAFGLPLAKLHWALTPRDKRTMLIAAETVDSELKRLNLGRVEIEPWLKSPETTFSPEMVGGYHHMGATRMSKDAKDGVVDANCKAHDVDNLYVAGASVFPTAGFVNPTATLIALAYRLAEHFETLPW